MLALNHPRTAINFENCFITILLSDQSLKTVVNKEATRKYS